MSPETQARFFVRRAAFTAGDLVAGRYEVVRLIGHGGMGDVYEVEDRELRTRVALKTIRTDRPSPLMVARFRREIYLARQVTHPNVCRVYDLGYHVNALFLTMELITGETLAERMRRAGPMTCDEALSILRQIAAAIDAAHTAGVVHRDLKPGNIVLVARDPLHAMVTDFGIAHAAEDPFNQVSHVGDVVGSPDYMSPEQIAGDPITPAADIFALGVVSYEMITGVRPFRGAAERGALLPPRVHVADLDPRWDAAIVRCLAPECGARFASAGELVRALEPRPRAGRGMRIAATGGGALLAAAAAAWWLGIDARAQASAHQPAPDRVAALAALPPGSEAAQRFSAGLVKLRELDAQAARVLLEEATALAPTNGLVHAELAEAWWMLGYDRDAAAEIQQAIALPGAARTLIDARANELAGDWERAISAYRALVRDYPDEVDYRLHLAVALTEANRGTEALAAIAELRLQALDAGDPRIDLAEAAAANAIGDGARERSAAERALQGARPERGRVLAAHAELALARALAFHGAPDRALAPVRSAKHAFALAGDKNHEARALAVEAYALAERGEVELAERLDEHVLALRRELGDRRNVARTLINLGLLAENRGQLERSTRLTREAADTAHAAADRRLEALALVRLAGIASMRGDPEAALALTDEALAVRVPDDLRAYYYALECRGAAEAFLGRLDDARAHIAQAFAVAQQLGAATDAADDLVFAAYLHIHAGDLATARRALADPAATTDAQRPESLAWRRTVGAQLALAERQPVVAARDARAAFDELVHIGHAVEALEPATTLVRAQLARGELAAAGDALERLAALPLEGRLARLTIALLRGELAATNGFPARAAALFASVRDEAGRAKLALLERDAGRDLAQLTR
jgi:eukaryotic-like serine/threonine-protein kinase